MNLTENTPDFGKISPHFTLPSDWRHLVQSFQLSDGVHADPGVGSNLAFLAAEKQLPRDFFDPDRPEKGGLLVFTGDYGQDHALFPLSALDDPYEFQAPKVDRHLFDEAGMTLRVRPDSVRQFSVHIPGERRDSGTYIPIRIADIEVRQEGRQDRCVRVVFTPVPAEQFFQFLGATEAHVVWISLQRHGGFSAPFTPEGKGLYKLAPRYAAKYLKKQPEAWLADAQFNAPPHPDWPDVCVRGLGWDETRLKAYQRPAGKRRTAKREERPERDRRPKRPVRWVHPDLGGKDYVEFLSGNTRPRGHRSVPPDHLEHLLAGLPCLTRADGLRPWHALKLERWGTLPERTDLERASTRFMLTAAERAAPVLGQFVPIRDLVAMDEVHRKTVEAWVLGRSMTMMTGLGMVL